MYTHTFATDQPPSALVVRERIDSETERTCTGVAVDWMADPPEVRVALDQEATGQDLTDIAAIVADHSPEEPVAAAKLRCSTDCAEQLMCKLDTGAVAFEYPAKSGNWFPLSERCLPVWNALHAARDSLTYPVTVRTIDFAGCVELANGAALDDFHAAAAVALAAEMDSCCSAIGTIQDAATTDDADTAAATYLGS